MRATWGTPEHSVRTAIRDPGFTMRVCLAPDESIECHEAREEDGCNAEDHDG